MSEASNVPLTARSALDLAGAIGGGEISSREVVEAHIEALRRAQPRTNALAVARFEAARAEADAVDRRLSESPADGPLPPLLGVPCTIKEVFNVAGLPHTAGLVARRGTRATRTAAAAQRLLDAGAIPLGLTNTAELAAWIECENRVYGRTNNPFDPRRTSGGSSGGCGAAVASGGSPLSLATDTVGSARIPAFFCGVFAHKPSRGLVPLTIDFPPIQGETKRMVTFGPVTRRAEDLMLALRVLAGPDGEDESVVDADLGDPRGVRLEGLRVLVSERAFLARIDRRLLEARERAADVLQRAGARVERIALPQMRRMVEPGLALLGDGGNVTPNRVLKATGAPPITLRRALARGGPHTAPLKTLALGEKLTALTPARRTRRLIARAHAFAEELDAIVGDGVLLQPPLPTVAVRHGKTYRRLLYAQPMAVFNVAGLPVTQVPLGATDDGLPLGVQVAAGWGRDHAAIAVALELERAFGGWVKPPRNG